jgi:hypothetical protein
VFNSALLHAPVQSDFDLGVPPGRRLAFAPLLRRGANALAVRGRLSSALGLRPRSPLLGKANLE